MDAENDDLVGSVGQRLEQRREERLGLCHNLNVETRHPRKEKMEESFKLAGKSSETRGNANKPSRAAG